MISLLNLAQDTEWYVGRLSQVCSAAKYFYLCDSPTLSLPSSPSLTEPSLKKIRTRERAMFVLSLYTSLSM